jgi:iron-sulfur cluster repair protein YtfE (RIC family)
MTTQEDRDLAARRQRRAGGTVDFVVMYAAHDAFSRDLSRLAGAVASRRSADPAVRTGWATFRNQLHVHHTAEGKWLWPPLRQRVTDRGELAVLDAMDAEHARIDPLLAQVDAALDAGDDAAVGSGAEALAAALTSHMEHEEEQALPLVAAHLGAAGWKAFGRRTGLSQGLRGAAEFFPWMLDGAPEDAARHLLATFPPPLRLLCRAVWQPAYARTPRWAARPA